IYGGTLKPIAGTQTGRGGVIFGEKLAQIHMHGGVITGGNVKSTANLASGGNVFLNEGAVFTLYGGTIEGGLAEGKNGGNVYANGKSFTYKDVDYTGGASFVMEGGTLRGGSADLGGNIYAEGNATVQIHGGSILYGDAVTAGGNIYMASGTTLSIDEDQAETLIDGGVALRGGNIMLAGAGATMDAGDIVSGKAFGTASSDGGANIYLDSSASFTMNQDEGKRSLIRGGFSTLTSYGGNVHNYGTFTMNNGRIDRGVMATQGSGGANLCNRGSFTMNDGFIGDTVRGYNILLVSKRLTVNGGTVSGGYANGEESRNVVAWDNSEFFMTGGRLVSNYSEKEGGSLFAQKGAILSLTGGTVTGNAGSEISVALVQADNVKRGTTLTITDASVDSLLLKDDNPTFDTTITISGKTYIGKVTRGGATKPLVSCDLTEGASVTFCGETVGEVFGSGSPAFIRSDNGLAAVLEGESLKWSDLLTDEALKFTGASVTLYSDLGVNFKVNGSVLKDYTDPFVKFHFGGEDITHKDYVISGGKYVFRFRDIAPHRIGDTITATLYAYKDGVLCQGATVTYSVKQYCYNMLETYNDVDYPAYGKLRTLLVDLLNYGAAAQTYTKYNTGALVNGELMDKQLTWGTATDPAVSNAVAREEQDGENPT
ncbi:MAG: hypothetical protein IJA84_03610, partial [Clostridia bacterium]|nr:hypothetical protein [Clostridia bacterium]